MVDEAGGSFSWTLFLTLILGDTGLLLAAIK
jgi:hypothetical protein